MARTFPPDVEARIDRALRTLGSLESTTSDLLGDIPDLWSYSAGDRAFLFVAPGAATDLTGLAG